MERLENVIRTNETPRDLVLLLRGGVDTEAKLLRQATTLGTRFTYQDLPARGISLFAAYDDLDERRVLSAKLHSYPRYRQVNARQLMDLVLLLPTFQSPHWTALFVPATAADHDEITLASSITGILGPVLSNPKYMADRARRR